MNRVAIIPARGGSKRLPRKNILPVKGSPMLSYPVRMAIESGLFEKVIVSTEDIEIGEVAREAGASVFNRPANLAEDRSTVVQVCQNVIEQLFSQNIYPDLFCCIYATAVVLNAHTIEQALGLYDESPRINYVMGVSKYNFPPVQALRADGNGFLSYMWPEYIGLQSQFHPELVVSNGSFVWARTDAFMRDKIFYAEGLKGYEVPYSEVMDIDTVEDYERIKKAMKD